MQFTNFEFQSKKNSSYIKKNNVGANIFKKLLDCLYTKGISNPLQAIEVITKLLLIKNIFESGLLKAFKGHPEAPSAVRARGQHTLSWTHKTNLQVNLSTIAVTYY